VVHASQLQHFFKKKKNNINWLQTDLQLGAGDGFAELGGDSDLAGQVLDLPEQSPQLVSLVQHLLLPLLVLLRSLCGKNTSNSNLVWVAQNKTNCPWDSTQIEH
jgi:hypothetical protein